jgi:hypothetical protein
MNSKIPGISLIRDTSEWLSVVERPPKRASSSVIFTNHDACRYKTRKCRIITLEDPVEYVFQSQQALISQRELGSNLSSFASGLKSALRESPDIIYVGEIRDAETASLALTAAETRHLVFSTLHTMDGKGPLAASWICSQASSVARFTRRCLTRWHFRSAKSACTERRTTDEFLCLKC